MVKLDRGVPVVLAIAVAVGALAAEAAAPRAPLEFDGRPLVTGLKCTSKGPPTEATKLLGYLDHFALDVKLKPRQGADGQAEGLRMAAWFGQLAEGQLDAKFGNPDDRGRPYQIEDASGALVAPQHPQNAKAIAFHPEASNRAKGSVNLSKGIGGRPVPLVPAAAGTVRLYSSMHQRFSYSLVAVVAQHAAAYGSRYTIEQLGKLPPGLYRLRLPLTVALIDGEKRVVDAVHGDTTLKLDLSSANREATIQSFKGSGAPLVPFE